MRSQKSGSKALVAVLIGLVITGGWTEPDRPKPKQKVPTTNKADAKRKKRKRVYEKAPPYSSLKKMDATAKREMSARRYQIVRAVERVKDAIRCSECKGKGNKKVKGYRPLPGRMSKEVSGRLLCSRCRGLKIIPSPQVHDLLSEYVKKKRSYQRDYPFVGAIDTGLEAWIADRVNNTVALEMLNRDSYERLKGHRFREGDVFLVCVQVFGTERVGNGKLLQAWLDPVRDEDERSNLMISFMDDFKQEPFQHFFMMVVYDGRTTYESVRGEMMSAEVMTCMGWKAFKLPPD